MHFTVRPLNPENHAAWRTLWEQYLGYHGLWPDQAASLTWTRLMDPNEPVFGLGAFSGDRLEGFAHFIFHRHTWTDCDVCFLSDLFTARAARKQGIARALVQAVFDRAAAEGAANVYGTTLTGNVTSQALYDQMAERQNLVVYRKDF